MKDTSERTYWLRPAGVDDVPAITAIYGHYVRTHTATFELDPPDEPEMAARMQSIADAGLPYWVAEKSRGVVGYCYVAPYRPRPAYRFTVEDSIYMLAHVRRRGIGRALLARLIDESARAGARQMIAVIGDSGNEASIRLHAALGFRHVGVLDSVGNKFSRWLDVVFMQRALGPGNATPAP